MSEPEAARGEERRPIMQHNGARTHAPRDAPTELASNYNTMKDDTLPLGGQEGTELSWPPRDHRDAEDATPNLQGGERWLSCLKGWLLMGSCCLLGVVAALLGIIVLAGYVALLEHLPRHTCTSAQCYKAAGDILGSLKESVSPCEDFAEYACGGWRREHPMPESRLRWGIFDNLDEQTLQDARGLLEEEAKEGEPHAIRVTKAVYQACVNDSQWEEVGLRPLLALLDREGGLPMIQPDWDMSHVEVMSSLARLRRTLANQYLVDVTVEPDSRNTSMNVIYLNQGFLPLRREYYTPDTPLSRYHQAARTALMRQTGEFLLTARQQERNVTLLNNLYRDVDDLWAFSVRVAEITKPVEGSNPWKLYNPMTVALLQHLTDASTTFKIDWLQFLREVFEDTAIYLTETQWVVVDRPDYFIRLVLLLQETPARTLANYLLFPVVVALGEETDGGVLTNPPLTAVTWSLGRRSSRTWYDCAKKVRLLLPFGVGALYTRHHLAPATQGLARQVVSDVTAAFRGLLEEASWIDAHTREEALHKLDKMQHLVAYPAHALSDTLLEEYHAGVPEANTSDHFGNMLALTAWHCHRSLLTLNTQQQRDRWPRGPLELNAFYSPVTNAIVIPLAVLQPPIFLPEKLTALNYGSLGAIIGHETTHGFDNKGRMRDAYGNLNHWWTNTTLRQYLNRTRCFVRQYSSYDATFLLPPHLQPGQQLLINGKRTVSENIADNGGLRAAWAAYRRRVDMEGRGRRISLPGLERFTDDQLFFISFAKVWCSQVTPFALHYILDADVHAPDPFRVLGALRNSPAFATAFQCPAGAPMNPEEKCTLW